MYRATYLSVLVLLNLVQSLPAADDPLVGWWQLDDGTGTIAIDSSGHDLTGTIIESKWVAPGHGGAGFCLEMDRTGWVDLGNPALLDFGAGDWTVTAWIQTTITGTAEADRGTIYAKGGDGAGGIRHTLCVGETQSGRVTLTCDDDVTKVQATSITRVNDGEWHFVAGLRDGDNIRVAIDGSFEGRNTVATAYSLVGTSQHNAYLGAITNHTDNALIKRYKGLMDDVRVYRLALTGTHLNDVGRGVSLDFFKATAPAPANGNLAVQTPLLEWTPGYKAAFHNVYFGTARELTQANLVMPRSVVAMYFHAPGLTPGTTYYWRIDEVEADGVTVHTGDVWRFTAQALTAYCPAPSDRTGDARTSLTLTWLPGQGAREHHVYFGTNKEEVTQGAAGTDKGLTKDATFAPGPLQPGTAYYWRVDEVGAGNTIQTGPVWSFTTILIVDDFEGYTDDEGQRIYETWIDGGTNRTGATVGYATAPFAEQKIVYGGKQSMPLDYNNLQSPYYSEAERQFTPVQNWAISGADTLALYLRGQTTNGDAPVYITLADASNRAATVIFTDIFTGSSVVTWGGWSGWNMSLAGFTDVNLAQVKKIVIGVGDKSALAPGSKGLIYVDDIYVYKSAGAN